MKRLRSILSNSHNLVPIRAENIEFSTGVSILCGGFIMMLLTVICPFLAIYTWLIGLFTSIIEVILYYHDKRVKKESIQEIINIIKDYEERLNIECKKDPIHFGGFVKNGDTDLRTFMTTFFHHNNNHHTVYADDEQSKERVTVQCSSGRRRSLGDIYRICKYYYPNCTLEEVLKILIWMTEGRMIGASYCHTILKYVFHTDSFIYKREDPVEFTDKYKFSHFIKVYNNYDTTE